MQRLQDMFRRARASSRAALIGYVALDDPSAQRGAELLGELNQAGLDAVELGYPAHNPFLDGATIRNAHKKALDAGTSLPETLKTVARYRELGGTMPIVLMGYADVLLGFGSKRFARRASATGVDAVIVADLSIRDASAVLLPALAEHQLAMIPIYSPAVGSVNVSQRIPGVGGFAYCIASSGHTGSKAPLAGAIARAVEQCRSHTPLPVCVGFGIKTPSTAQLAAAHADGVIVGSALVNRIQRDLGGQQAAKSSSRYPRAVRYVASLRDAMQKLPSVPEPGSGVPSDKPESETSSQRRATRAFLW
jgi:tryptophan synthase alpha chain